MGRPLSASHFLYPIDNVKRPGEPGLIQDSAGAACGGGPTARRKANRAVSLANCLSAERRSLPWVALYFYPKDHTPGCTDQACDFRDNTFAFRDAGAVILGISVDDVITRLMA